jgi:hypothetical protein
MFFLYLMFNSKIILIQITFLNIIVKIGKKADKLTLIKTYINYRLLSHLILELSKNDIIILN